MSLLSQLKRRVKYCDFYEVTSPPETFQAMHFQVEVQRATRVLLSYLILGQSSRKYTVGGDSPQCHRCLRFRTWRYNTPVTSKWLCSTAAWSCDSDQWNVLATEEDKDKVSYPNPGTILEWDKAGDMTNHPPWTEDTVWPITFPGHQIQYDLSR